ncbi:MAG: threonylcarbamoyl-AMP synthase [Candidatus Lambdaproteobacteria bacterium RIFOXYD12_FULL_49_8]|uniref:Threonylcarbamoyl-AMP synthase n=1 Tax=Candidatus Lambdaproteobacteria bacterium RIFOXYD2_FULL_50_16 TaxID=1817772 RepID=A0A1F6GG73_9PROT|nr:MAG: threonylcarbamoyl-AMP synthase [Candidatus Lambdaproteobacteria bacterium RIFOXYD12_FULL_49_8]OGG97103.1 MAG: threonylcarbamoyl-AMP synthase [Candidatus Lambdaproteobacteria bacterium RIFOXYD2_FULL_50_16]
MIVDIHPETPQARKIAQVVELLKNDGLIIMPTGTSYVFGCAISSKQAMKRIYQIKEMEKNQPLTFICSDTRQFEQYTKGIPNPVFRKIRSLLPGPYTFIFQASKLIPKTLLSPRATIGVKMPNSPIALSLAEAMNEPIVTSSVPLDPEQEYFIPWYLEEEYGNQVDLIVDGGEVFISESSIVDFSHESPQIIRQGTGNLDWLE